MITPAQARRFGVVKKKPKEHARIRVEYAIDNKIGQASWMRRWPAMLVLVGEHRDVVAAIVRKYRKIGWVIRSRFDTDTDRQYLHIEEP